MWEHRWRNVTAHGARSWPAAKAHRERPGGTMATCCHRRKRSTCADCSRRSRAPRRPLAGRDRASCGRPSSDGCCSRTSRPGARSSRIVVSLRRYPTVSRWSQDSGAERAVYHLTLRALQGLASELDGAPSGRKGNTGGLTSSRSGTSSWAPQHQASWAAAFSLNAVHCFGAPARNGRRCDRSGKDRRLLLWKSAQGRPRAEACKLTAARRV